MFGLSTKGDYGLSFLGYLVEKHPQTISLKEVAAVKRLPIKYLERLATILKKSGVIISKEGAGGGYGLAVSPRRIKLVRVLMVLEGDLIITSCAAGLKCTRSGQCGMKDGWLNIRQQIFKILSQYSLADLFNN